MHQPWNKLPENEKLLSVHVKEDELMNVFVKLAEGFTGIVSAGGENLMGLITGILPNLLILLTCINAIITLGHEFL